jgi:hypothetical protein
MQFLLDWGIGLVVFGADWQKTIPQLSMFCLIQGFYNYVQINTF